MPLSEQEIIRRQERQQLLDLGIDPYPADIFKVTHSTTQIVERFNKEEDLEKVVIAGRLMSRRIMGSASFAELQDASGRIQLYLKRDDLCPDEDKTLYNTVFKKVLGIGDIIGVTGNVFKTQSGEITVNVQTLVVLSKSLRPLPIVKETTDEQGNKILAKEHLLDDDKLELCSIAELIRHLTAMYFTLNMEYETKVSDDIEALIKKRNEARKNKDFIGSDRIRDELLSQDIILEDTKKGTTWRKKD